MINMTSQEYLNRSAWIGSIVEAMGLEEDSIPLPSKEAALLIIDPQNDFLPQQTNVTAIDATYSPSLQVPNGLADMDNIARLIHCPGICSAFVTLDTHHNYHIAHLGYWKDMDGNSLDPTTDIFSMVVASKSQSGKIVFTMTRANLDFIPDKLRGSNQEIQPLDSNQVLKAYNTLEAMRRHCRKPLVLWPNHCIEGSLGHEITPVLKKALKMRLGNLNVPQLRLQLVNKGLNPHVEFYSVFLGEAPIGDNPSEISRNPLMYHTEQSENFHLDSTYISRGYNGVDPNANMGLIIELLQYKKIYVCGEAGSHCVKGSTEDLVKVLETLNSKLMFHGYEVILVEDATSPVQGFESAQAEIVQYMRNPEHRGWGWTKARRTQDIITEDGVCTGNPLESKSTHPILSDAHFDLSSKSTKANDENPFLAVPLENSDEVEN